MAGRFTARQIAFVRRHYPDKGSHYCAERLGLLRTQIVQMANWYGIKLSPLGWGRSYIRRVEAYRRQRHEQWDITPDELERRKATVRGERQCTGD